MGFNSAFKGLNSVYVEGHGQLHSAAVVPPQKKPPDNYFMGCRKVSVTGPDAAE